MSNTIGNNPVNLAQFQQTEAAKSAHHRGDVGNTGKKETRVETPPSDSLDGSSKTYNTSDGRTVNRFEDGSVQYQAPNGTTKHIDKDGNTSFTLPNGIEIQHNNGEEPVAFDPQTGNYLAVTLEKETPESYTHYNFKDSQGNKFSLNQEKLSFETENPSGTLKQLIYTNGTMEIGTYTVSKDPKTGKISHDENFIFINKDGKVDAQLADAENIAINNKGIHFTANGDMNVGITFPYPPPMHLTGPSVRPDLPPITQEPVMPPPQQQVPPPQCNPQPGFGGFPGGIGGYPGWSTPGFPGEVYQGFPWGGFPIPGNPVPKPGPQPGDAPPAFDPYAPLMTPSGFMRKKEPDGSLFISLPNGIVLNQMPDGRAQAFDARKPGAVIPVVAQQVDNPGFGPETRFNFQDADGNLVTLYSQTLDFAASSSDGNVMQTVSPNGDMLIHARTITPGADGQPNLKNHKILVTGDGKVNTFGERGVQVNNKNVVFADGGTFTNYKLPYEIPPHQGFMPYIPPMGVPPMGSPMPVPNPMEPAMTMGPGGFAQTAGSPPPVDTKEPVYPPGQKPGVDEKAKAGEAKADETPGEKPVKPGIWQKIKDFFKGEDPHTNTSYHNNNFNNYCYGNQWGTPYPGGYCQYNQPTFGQKLAYGALLGLQAGGSMLMSSMMMYPMMMSYPMGMYYNPYGMFGMSGMW
ncbi:MAG: hypothetical protein LWY06_19275 [Firmicutes bacterium]|nr:hypothetical protein [Bacillota bacterium]